MSPTDTGNENVKPAAVKVDKERKFSEPKHINECLPDQIEKQSLPVYDTQSESEESKEEKHKLEKFLVKGKPVNADEPVNTGEGGPRTKEKEAFMAKQARDCITKGPGVACDPCLKGEERVWNDVEDYLTKIASKLTNTHPTIDNFKVRLRLYEEYTHRVHGKLGRGKRIPLPACVELMIKLTWPNDTYHGFDDHGVDSLGVDEGEEEED
jgi:hypothetical protein